MAASSATQVVRVTGKLVINPTNLAAAFPYGGTELGAARKIALKTSYPQDDIRAEEFGGELVEAIELGPDDVSIAALLRQWDADVISTIFPATLAPGDGTKTIDIPGSFRAGGLASSRSVKLLFAAIDSTKPSVIIYRALPMLDPSGVLELSIFSEAALLVKFRGVRDASGRIARMNKIGNLAL